MLAASVSLPCVSAQLGHADASITTRVYAHLISERDLGLAGATFDDLAAPATADPPPTGDESTRGQMRGETLRRIALTRAVPAGWPPASHAGSGWFRLQHCPSASYLGSCAPTRQSNEHGHGHRRCACPSPLISRRGAHREVKPRGAGAGAPPSVRATSGAGRRPSYNPRHVSPKLAGRVGNGLRLGQPGSGQAEVVGGGGGHGG